MKIWVVYRDYGSEGKSEPLAVFRVESERDAFLAGAVAGDCSSMGVREFDLPVEVSSDLPLCPHRLLDAVCELAEHSAKIWFLVSMASRNGEVSYKTRERLCAAIEHFKFLLMCVPPWKVP